MNMSTIYYHYDYIHRSSDIETLKRSVTFNEVVDERLIEARKQPVYDEYYDYDEDEEDDDYDDFEFTGGGMLLSSRVYAYC